MIHPADPGRAEAPDHDQIRGFEDRLRSAYRHVELAVREGTMLLGHDGVVVHSIRAHERLGLDQRDLEGGPPLPSGWSMFGEDGALLGVADHPGTRALLTGEQHERTVIIESPAGERRSLRFVAHPVTGDDVVAVDVLVADHDRRVQTRELLERRDSRFRTITDMLPVAVWEASPSGDVTYVNPMFTEMTGRTVAETPGLPMLELVHSDDALDVMQAAVAATEGSSYRSEYRLMHTDGSSRWVVSRMTILVDEHGKMNGFAGSMEDIDDLHRSRRRSDRLAQIVEAAGDAIAIIEDGEVAYTNRAATLLLERTDPAFAVDRRRHTFEQQFRDRYAHDVVSALRATGEWSSDVQFVDVDGQNVDLALSVRAEVEADVPVRAIVMARDIADRKRREDRLAHDAVHDPLTGLANRHGLARAVAELEGNPLVDVCFVDIDHFKVVNDTFGHVAGDAVLVDVASRLRRVFGAGAIVARVGGDEMLALRPTAEEPLTDLAQRVVESAAESDVSVREGPLNVTVTVGAARGMLAELDALTAAADDALYAAKVAGRNTWSVAD
ncbi:MAG: diguanylate cyclase [Ilumatobacter sp.]